MIIKEKTVAAYQQKKKKNSGNTLTLKPRLSKSRM